MKGMEFESENDAYESYNHYEWRVGFSVPREYTNKVKKTGYITSRKITCCGEDF